MNIVYIDGPDETEDGVIEYRATATNEDTGRELISVSCPSRNSAWQAAWQLSDKYHAVEVVDDSTPY